MNRMGIIIDEFREFKAYMKRECYVCHQKVPKGQGYESMASFHLVHEECFDKLRPL